YKYLNNVIIVIPGRVLVTPGNVVVTPGSVVVTTGSVVVTPGSVVVTTGSVVVTPGSIAVTPGSVAVTPGSVAVTPGSVAVTPGSVAVTPGSVVVTPGSVVVTPGSVVVTPGSVVVTPGSVVVTPGSVVVTPDGVVVTPGSVVVTTGSVVVTSGKFVMSDCTTALDVISWETDGESVLIESLFNDLDLLEYSNFISSACRRTHYKHTAEDDLEVFSIDDLGLDWISAHNILTRLQNLSSYASSHLESEEEHEQHLRIVLEILRQKKLRRSLGSLQRWKLSPNGETYFVDGSEKFGWGLAGYYRVLLGAFLPISFYLLLADEKGFPVFSDIQLMIEEKVGMCFDATWEDLETLSRRWLELLKIYDTIHPSSIRARLLRWMLSYVYEVSGGKWACMSIESNPNANSHREAQRDDGELVAIVQMLKTVNYESVVDDDGVVWFEDRLCVPNDRHFAILLVERHEARCGYVCIQLCMGLSAGSKLEHQRASGLLQPLEIPMWKWDEISMDFVTGLPTTQKRHDAIWVVVDRLTKSAFFLPFRKKLWITEKLGDLVLSSVQHLSSTEGRQERTNSDFGRFVEGLCFGFTWTGPSELIEITNEKVAVAKEKLKEARSRQKSYADKHRRDLEFQVGDRVFLKVSPFRGVKRFWDSKGLISPRFHRSPFVILERYWREVSYRLVFLRIQPDCLCRGNLNPFWIGKERVMEKQQLFPFVKILWKKSPRLRLPGRPKESCDASDPHFLIKEGGKNSGKVVDGLC
ncbi:retrotransposon protein, putative, ty3-gypsy subclass, partial [Tanacetum coccineum]